LFKTKLSKGELCKIEDNSNQISWKVVSIESRRDALVPSVYFLLKGPDPDLVESIDNLKFKHDQLKEDMNKFNFLLKKDKISRMMADILSQSRASKFLGDENSGGGGGCGAEVTDIVKNVREEIESIISSTQSINCLKQNRTTLILKSSDECSSLISEFREFDKNLKQMVSCQMEESLQAHQSRDPSKKHSLLFAIIS
jgi:hypothetical protein